MQLFDAAIDNLNASENKLCYNNFAYSMRELSRHILKDLSPDDKVLNSFGIQTKFLIMKME
ncbi:MAG: hypothetical protein IPN86_07690 [Saprospiraceae bacterium]|nr:hypothetical protein [Saprospiraceae bacterium]